MRPPAALGSSGIGKLQAPLDNKKRLVGWRGLSALAAIALPLHAHAEAPTHWAFQPVAQSSPPDVADTALGDIDRFILARLREEGLETAPRADAATLLRRVYLVLTGLPPTVEELRAFLADPSDEAYRQVVDRLLASPEFGERWGRHWLDVARFAESSGGGRSLMFPEAWRYRDYVIAALNDDVPFDQFIVEQIAGDLLAHDSPAERDRQLTASGFLVLGAINYELQDKALLELEVVDEQIEVVGRAFLALSLGCARCHDHKFDPVSQDDYYGLAGIFTSTHSVVHANVGSPNMAPLTTAPELAKYEEHQARIQSLAAELEQLAADVAESNEKQAQFKELEQRLQKLKKQVPARPMALAARDRDEVGDTHLRIAGDAELLGDLIPRGFVPAAGGEPPKIAAGQSGRLELARWVASPDNHLTSRVIVNRVWHHCLGEGLVRTPDDFGITGRPPTHPELLDYLATTFVDDGWSIKRLVRRIVLSETFRRSSEGDAGADPENRYLARAHLRHLDAESLRDALLAVSGLLDPARGGPTIRKLAEYDYNYQFDSRRRSVYVPRFRSEQLDAFSVFDCANNNMVVGRREQTILPTQALFMLNSPLVIESSDEMARHLLAEIDEEDVDDRRIERLFQLAVSRPPTGEERKLATDYLHAARENADATEQEVYSGLCQLVFCSLDFRFLR